MSHFFRVACACMSGGYPAIGKFHSHHVIDVSPDNLVTIEQDDALSYERLADNNKLLSKNMNCSPYLVLRKAPRRKLLPSALVDFPIPRRRLYRVDYDSRNSCSFKSLHVLLVGFNILCDHDYELVF